MKYMRDISHHHQETIKRETGKGMTVTTIKSLYVSAVLRQGFQSTHKNIYKHMYIYIDICLYMSITYIVCHNLYIMNILLTLSIIPLPTILLEE